MLTGLGAHIAYVAGAGKEVAEPKKSHTLIYACVSICRISCKNVIHMYISSAYLWKETVMTLSVVKKASSTPSPWCTSMSIYSTRG